MSKRRYTDEERAQALAVLEAEGGNASRASARLGIPRVTLIYWADGTGAAASVESLTRQRQALADRIEDLAHRIIDAVPGKIPEAHVQQLMVSLGIAVDKLTILHEKRLGRSGDAGASAAIAALLDRLDSAGGGGRDAGQPAPPGPPGLPTPPDGRGGPGP